jgi:hypothetical protein
VNGFLEELGKKAAERWLSLLLLPGLLWTTTLLAALHLPHHHPLNLTPARDAATRWAAQPHTAATLALALAGLLLVSTAAGLAATGTATLLRRIWILPGHRPPARWLARHRRRRWERRNRQAQASAADDTRHAPPPAKPDSPLTFTVSPATTRAFTRRDTISLDPPQRPTWIGDRWHSLHTRVHRAHGLDLNPAWPRLWTLLPDNLRNDITTAHTRYTHTSTLTAWALLYLIPALHYWPAALITLYTLTIGAIRARSATDTLCTLIETATDLHTHTLAEHLTTPDPDTARTINQQLRKPPPTP